MDPFNQLPCSLSLVWKEEKNEGWKDWTLKSRLGNELLFTQGIEDISVKGGWLFIKCRVCQWGDNMQFEASRRSCAVAVLLIVVILNVTLKLRCCFVTETHFVPENVRIHACFTSGDYIKWFSHRA